MNADVVLVNVCKHCGSDVPKRRLLSTFCCTGCEYVYGLLHDLDLEKFYTLRPKKIMPLLGYSARRESLVWLTALLEEENESLKLRVEGIQCAACVWLIKKLASQADGLEVHVNAAVGTIQVDFDSSHADVKKFLASVEKCGYRVSRLEDPVVSNESHNLLIRLGICAAATMNSMMFSIAVYTGLAPSGGNVYGLFQGLNFALGTIVFLVGGSYFFIRAYRGLAQRVLHFDLPISLGVLAAYFGSTYAFFTNLQHATYFDSLTAFVTLLLAGRYVQDRTLLRNQRRIADKTSLDAMRVKRVSGTIHEVAFNQIQHGDQLIIAVGGVLPVDSVLHSPEKVETDLSWINGEAATKIYSKGEVIPAGATVVSVAGCVVTAKQNFSKGTLSQLLVSDIQEREEGILWQAVSRWYVSIVLVFIALGFLLWLPIDLIKAYEVAIAISVVTCPCGLGIAIPLARNMASRVAAEHGVFVRRSSFFHRLQQVNKIIFDKTGTLTLSKLEVVQPTSLDSLLPHEKQVLFNMCARSLHPVSQAIYQYMLRDKFVAVALSVQEEPGVGLAAVVDMDRFFVGRSNDDTEERRTLFSKNDRILAEIDFREVMLEDAPQTVQRLIHSGIECFQMSGDCRSRVSSMAATLGIPRTHSFAECNPTKKEQLTIGIDDEDTLYIGDGINDALAARAAYVRGAALGDQRHLVNESDFFFVADSLRWLPMIIKTASRLQSTLYWNLTFAALYNTVAVILALMGLISPLVCAVLMPISSIISIALSTYRMQKVDMDHMH